MGVTRVPFKSSAIYSQPTTAATTVVAIDCLPGSISSRLGLMVQAYKKWRWAGPLRISAEVDYQPVLANNAGTWANAGIMTAVAYYGAPSGSTGAVVNSISDLTEMVHSNRGMRRSTVVVPLSALREGQLAPWMLTTIGSLTSATEDEIGGCVFAAFSCQGTTPNATRCWVHIDGIMEFSDPTEPSVTSNDDIKMPTQLYVVPHAQHSSPDRDEDEKVDQVWLHDPERPVLVSRPTSPRRTASLPPPKAGLRK